MEQLQELLRQYNNTHIDEYVRGGGWNKMYQQRIFPEYWKRVFIIANSLPRSLRVLEIGSGFGFVTSIFAYLGFKTIVGFERDTQIANSASARLKFLFNIFLKYLLITIIIEIPEYPAVHDRNLVKLRFRRICDYLFGYHVI